MGERVRERERKWEREIEREKADKRKLRIIDFTAQTFADLGKGDLDETINHFAILLHCNAVKSYVKSLPASHISPLFCFLLSFAILSFLFHLTFIGSCYTIMYVAYRQFYYIPGCWYWWSYNIHGNRANHVQFESNGVHSIQLYHFKCIRCRHWISSPHLNLFVRG